MTKTSKSNAAYSFLCQVCGLSQIKKTGSNIVCSKGCGSTLLLTAKRNSTESNQLCAMACTIAGGIEAGAKEWINPKKIAQRAVCIAQEIIKIGEAQ